jgi:hypothetical protein
MGPSGKPFRVRRSQSIDCLQHCKKNSKGVPIEKISSYLAKEQTFLVLDFSEKPHGRNAKPISANLAGRCVKTPDFCPGGPARIATRSVAGGDFTIVARYEVPGMGKNRAPSRRDFTIEARQFIAWIAYEEGPRPGGTPDSGQA